jgi:hypothetical protein
MRNLDIPHTVAADWGAERFKSVIGQIRETVEAETGQPHEWRLDWPSDIWRLFPLTHTSHRR